MYKTIFYYIGDNRKNAHQKENVFMTKAEAHKLGVGLYSERGYFSTWKISEIKRRTGANVVLVAWSNGVTTSALELLRDPKAVEDLSGILYFKGRIHPGLFKFPALPPREDLVAFYYYSSTDPLGYGENDLIEAYQLFNTRLGVFRPYFHDEVGATHFSKLPVKHLIPFFVERMEERTKNDTN